MNIDMELNSYHLVGISVVSTIFYTIMASYFQMFWWFCILNSVCAVILVVKNFGMSLYHWGKDRASYNTSLLHIFRVLQKVRRERGHKDLSTLEVHIVSRRPLYHCDPWWGIFMFELKRGGFVPGVRKLNLTYIIQQEEDDFKKTIKPIHRLTGNRTVNYALKHTLYHMYFSSENYIEPDAVIILDNADTMLREEDELHREISYRNITSKARTALVLVDRTDRQLDRGVEAVNEARPVDQEHSQYQTTEYSRYKFTMLRRKNEFRKK